ncbi:MAG: aminoacyl-tRNA hydrolase [Phycisphaerales bacterium]|jgi:PTH1 family peptidyl-tRNA hydrolase|nr:aminoacyl-tRNA hydrolase [Phycisphaerales bacterium]
MKLIVGLGNPEKRYEKTRHNAGFMAIDRLADKFPPGAAPSSRFQGACVETQIGPERCLLLKPLTYMNLSGRSVAEAVRFYKLDPLADLIVLVDDTALDVGQIRVRSAGSAGGHNGLSDIQRALGTEAYPRVRIGVGAKPPVVVLSDWVLSRFREDEEAPLKASLDAASGAVEAFVRDGIDAAMNRFNAPPARERPRNTREGGANEGGSRGEAGPRGGNGGADGPRGPAAGSKIEN